MNIVAIVEEHTGIKNITIDANSYIYSDGNNKNKYLELKKYIKNFKY